jgi:hypothetical protein
MFTKLSHSGTNNSEHNSPFLHQLELVTFQIEVIAEDFGVENISQNTSLLYVQQEVSSIIQMSIANGEFLSYLQNLATMKTHQNDSLNVMSIVFIDLEHLNYNRNKVNTRSGYLISNYISAMSHQLYLMLGILFGVVMCVFLVRKHEFISKKTRISNIRKSTSGISGLLQVGHLHAVLDSKITSVDHTQGIDLKTYLTKFKSSNDHLEKTQYPNQDLDDSIDVIANRRYV